MTATSPAASDRGQSHGARLLERKNVLELTLRERAAFVSAVRELDRTPSPYDPTLSYYDQFVSWHVELYRCSAGHSGHAGAVGGHGSALFLPWHRAFVHLLEQALRSVSGRRIAVPYWDWTDPASRAAVFAEDLMGGDGDPGQGHAVTTGPFRRGEWVLDVRPEGLLYTGSHQPHLVRKLGADLPVPLADVVWALRRPAYDSPPYSMRADPETSFRNALEGWWRADPAGRRVADPVEGAHCGPDGRMFPSRDAGELHNQVHSWTGGIVADPRGPTTFGTMLLSTSPADPVFFLHHANVDRLWAKWQDLTAAPFVPSEVVHVPMEPFASDGVTLTVADVLAPDRLGYRYSDWLDSDDVVVPKQP